MMAAAEQGQEQERNAACPDFNGVEIFTVTKAKERDKLSQTITGWINANRAITIVDYKITQSSDSEFHCLTVAIFYRIPKNARIEHAKKPEHHQRRR